MAISWRTTLHDRGRDVYGRHHTIEDHFCNCCGSAGMPTMNGNRLFRYKDKTEWESEKFCGLPCREEFAKSGKRPYPHERGE